MKGIHDFEPGDIKIVLSRHRLDLDTTSMRQICDCLPAERWRELLSVRHCKRKLSVLKRRFRFDDVRCPDVSVAGFDTNRDSKASDSNSRHEHNDRDLQVGHLIGAVHRMVHGGPQTGCSPSSRNINPLRYAARMGSIGLPSGVHVSQALPVAEHDLTGAGKPKHAVVVKLRQRPRHRL